jgi:hypothetical protein
MPLIRLSSFLLNLLAGFILTLQPAAAQSAPSPAPLASVALFYGAAIPWPELRAFDLAVVEPDHLPPGALPALDGTRLAAYLSLGEVQPSRSYAPRIPRDWVRGVNPAWGSWLIDQAQPGWPAFVAEEIVAPLWQRGLRTFFLDTLDAYHRHARSPEERATQEAGLVAVLRELVRRYPGIRFVFNRGFEILPQTHAWVDAVAAESLYRRYEPETGRYGEVPEADRRWLLERLDEVRQRYRLPTIAIDYVPAGERALARETAARIAAHGVVPWVSTPELDMLGVGSVEVMPRRVLVVHSPAADEYALRYIEPVRLGSMPLQHLGYVPEFVDWRQLPAQRLAGRYAGIVVWLQDVPQGSERAALLQWLQRQRAEGLPLLLMHHLEDLLDGALAQSLGLQWDAAARSTAAVTIAQQDAIMGFELKVRPAPEGFFPLQAAGAQPWLTLARGDARQVAAARMPWGAYVLDPYALTVLPGADMDTRWVINPFELFRQGLQLPDMPVPDVTTESGRRMLLVHMDGDGFVSRSELPGNKLAGEVLLERVVRRYAVPMTISVIEGEIAPHGLHPALSASAERAAREIFQAAHVAIASHSYSHPFKWGRLAAGDQAGPDTAYNLPLPGYAFDLEREILGSTAYIESRLAPPGKKVQMFLWTGDCIPGQDAVGLASRAGLLNMNGGDTTITRSQPSLTLVEGLGLARGPYYQVFAPNQNENVYTNNWTGPYYGFERVIETFELTEAPRRLKPINVYFHTYLLTKRAGMQSFDRIMQWALRQEVTPVHAADYARKVLDFQDYVVARTPQGWRVAGQGALRTLRLPAALGVPDLARSRAVAGWRDGSEGRYVHLAAQRAELALSAEAAALPRLHAANARIDTYTHAPGRQRWHFSGEVPLEFTLADAEGCRVQLDGRELRPLRRADRLTHYSLPAHAAGPIEALCQR